MASFLCHDFRCLLERVYSLVNCEIMNARPFVDPVLHKKLSERILSRQELGGGQI